MKLPELSPSQERRGTLTHIGADQPKRCGVWVEQRHSRGDSSGQRRMIKVLLLRLACPLQAETVPVTRALWCLGGAASQPGGQFRPAPNDQGTLASIDLLASGRNRPHSAAETVPFIGIFA